MNRFKNILYVSEPAAEQSTAIARAVSLAENNQADLTVIDVMPILTAGVGLPPGGPISSDLQNALLEERRTALNSLVGPYTSRLNIRIEVLLGINFLEVIRKVLRNDHDLVVKAAQDPSWLSRLFGSDDMHLLRKCPCPVWLMKPAERPNYEVVLAAVDFEPGQPESIGEGLNRRILELSGSLAVSDFATLHLVHTWDAPAEGIMRTWGNDPNQAGIGYVEAERLAHQNSMEQLDKALRDHLGKEAYDYLKPRYHLIRGAAETTVPALANELKADVVVMGTVARSGISGLFIGNTAETILEQLQCSVLAIKPPRFESPVKIEE